MAELAHTLPASWYCSSPLYQLERKSVFMKSWYLLGPVTKFRTVGEKIAYEIAQRPILAFRTSGNTPFPSSDEFSVICAETETPLRYHITPTGLIFSTISTEAPSFHDFFPDMEPLLARVDFTRLPYRHSIKYEGNFNWKTMIDGYQECLHCQYTHPTFSKTYPSTFYAVHNHHNFSQHIADPSRPDDGLFLYFFPICTLNVYGGGMSSFRVCPTPDPGVTRMEFDYYHLDAGDEFAEYFGFVRQVAMEDFELCERAQGNLGAGVYGQGVLNPVKEGGVAFYQGRVFELVCAQFETDRHIDHDADIRVMAMIYSQAIPTLLAVLVGVVFVYRVRSASVSEKTERHLVCKECEFPADWWTGRDIFEVERRAIFSKTWLCLAHRSRFAKTGDYQCYDVAGFSIFLIRGKDGEVRAFHNVCRHRAYAVTKKERGSAAVLGCRYHGWSYNVYGELVKAPHFDELPGFDRSRNSLFAIHAATTDDGFVFVNLDSRLTVSPLERGFHDAFENHVQLKAGSEWVFGDAVDGSFNWKVATVGHGAFIDVGRLERAVRKKSFLSSILRMLHRSQGQSVHSLFPITSVYAVSGTGCWFTLTLLPKSEQKTTVRVDVYGPNGGSTCMVGNTISDLLKKRVLELELEYQLYIDRAEQSGFECNNTEKEVQKNILDRVKSHSRLEKLQGTEVFPASREPRQNSKFQQADQLCKSLDCKDGTQRKDLAW
ncbi:hypothetical protein BDV25DRAFT_171620 [Aspergillus avenaceus]|uniref:Choline monooxygenase, chloroplastic n=1 Tax=Aspergillus avenaceus TaxID=36643 RepID=A0A5N6TY41_ASPAV|nr:hypothetical protein BDV25DRAFT_171620 [Aspergillus avenaceus]